MSSPLPNDPLEETRLRTVLGARPFRFFPAIGSTNDTAREWALSGAPTGSVVLTEEQTTGRGRFGREWSAPPGTALLMSVILRPRIAQEHLPRLTMVGAVSVAEAVEPLLGARATKVLSLKWPNDVWLSGRKVAGILPEAIWEGSTMQAVILGIGLNVRIDFVRTPLEGKAISLETVASQTIDRADLLAKLLHRIDYWSVRVDDEVELNANNSSLFAAWRSRLNTIGLRVRTQRVTSSGSVPAIRSELVGQAVDVDSDGALLLKTDDGTIHRIIAGEVTLAE